MRVTGAGALAVVLVDGGRRAEAPGTWSASLQWLVSRLAPSFPGLAFAEVRYRVKSWRRLDLCVEDAAAAIGALARERTLVVGFSMGGAVAVAVAGHPSVTTVVGLAPSIPARQDLSPLRGRRLAVAHGRLDLPLPGIPGVRPHVSLRAVERARAHGIEATHTLIPGALHGPAVRGPWGRPLPLPRAERWASFLAAELARFTRGSAG